MHVETIGVCVYYTLFTDDASRKRWAELHVRRSQHSTILLRVIIRINACGYTVCEVLCNNASEYLDADADAVLRDFKVTRTIGNPYESWQQGVSERGMLITVESAHPARPWHVCCLSRA